MYVLKALESYNYFSLSRSLTLYLTEEFGVSDYKAGKPCRCRAWQESLHYQALPPASADVHSADIASITVLAGKWW
jgi:hypothetical protein